MARSDMELNPMKFPQIRQFVLSEDGPTAVEYAVMLALIVVAIVGIVGALGTSISSTFNSVSSAVSS